MTFPGLALGFLVIGAATIGGAVVTRRYFLVGMLGSTLLLALHGRIYLNYISDDGYIYFQYARNLAEGHGPTFNAGGERVEGYMSILWVLVLAGAFKLGLDLPETARYLGFALGVGSLAMLYPLARAIAGNGRWPLAPVLAGIALAATTPFALWTFAGMEGPLLILLLLVGIWLHLREDGGPPGAVPWSGAVFALAMMSRPEAAVLVAVTAIFKLASLHDAASRGTRLLQCAVWGALILLLYGSYVLWRYDYYGYLLPNTYYAKLNVNLDALDRGVRYLVFGGTDGGLLVLAAAVVALLALARPLKPVLYLAALAAAWLVWVAFSGGDSLLAARFIEPILPVIYLAAGLGAAAALALVPPSSARAVLPAGALLFGGMVMASLYGSLDLGIPLERGGVADRVAIGRWMGATLPPGTSVAVTPAGAIPYESGLPALDMLGLNDTHIGRASTAAFGEGPPGHEKYDIDYVLEQSPAVIFVFNALASGPARTAGDYARLTWNFPAEYLLVHDPRTFQRYRPFWLELQPGRWLNLLIDERAAGVWNAVSGQASLGQ